MADADSKQYCPLLKMKIRRAACYEVGEALNDEMDMELCCYQFDLEEAKKICPVCGWDMTPIE